MLPKEGTGLANKLRSSFATGLLVLAPLFVTAIFLKFVMRLLRHELEGVFAAPLRLVLEPLLEGSPWYETVETAFLFFIGLPLVLGFILLCGWAVKHYVGQKLVAMSERAIFRIPLLGGTYDAAKRLVGTLTSATQRGVGRVVLAEYPRRGIWSVGFITATSRGEVQHRTADVVVGVYFPTTPNPTQGLLVFVPRDEIILLRMGFDDGMKLVISGGMMKPAKAAPALAAPGEAALPPGDGGPA